MKLSNIFIAMLIMAAGWSCYDNKGNDSYVEKMGIQVDGIEPSFHVNVADVIQIRPKVYPENREYKYFWGIANKNNPWSVIDTLSHEKDLDFKADLRTGNYLLRFYAEDVATGIFSYTEYDLFVETDMATGWWILKEEGGNTDIDFFSETKKKENLLKMVNGASMKGKPVDLSFTLNYWYFNEELETDEQLKAVFVASENDVNCLDFFTAKVLNGFDKLFYEKPGRGHISELFRGASDTHLVLDGAIYTMPNLKYDHYRQFTIKHTGDYKLSHYIHSTGYGMPLLFDENSSSFAIVSRQSLELDYMGNNNSFGPHKNTGMDLIFMGGKSVYNDGDEVYAILKKKGEEVYKLAHLEGAPRIGRSPLKEEMKEMKNDLKVLKGEFKTMNQRNNLIYFFEGNQMWAYNIDLGTEAKESIQLKPGEKVTYMDYARYAPWGLDDTWFDYIVIAVEKDGNYTVSMHPLQAGKIQPAVKQFTGKGKVQRALFIANTPKGCYTCSYL